jgi:hypothetical protein
VCNAAHTAQPISYFALRREEFMGHYHQRSNVESTFWMVQSKFNTFVRSKTDTAMKNKVLTIAATATTRENVHHFSFL